MSDDSDPRRKHRIKTCVQPTTTYDYYEDFEDYTVDTNAWTGTTAGVSLGSENGSNYLNYACTGSSSVGAYAAIPEMNCDGKTVRVEADIKFAFRIIDNR